MSKMLLVGEEGRKEASVYTPHSVAPRWEMSPKTGDKDQPPHSRADGHGSLFLSLRLLFARWWCVFVLRPPSHFYAPSLKSSRMQRWQVRCAASMMMPVLLPPPFLFCCSVSLVPPQLRLMLPSFLVLYAQVIGQARTDCAGAVQEEGVIFFHWQQQYQGAAAAAAQAPQKHTRPQPAPLLRAPGS